MPIPSERTLQLHKEVKELKKLIEIILKELKHVDEVNLNYKGKDNG